MPLETCPICDTPEPRTDLRSNRAIDCYVCGLYLMPSSIADYGISNDIFPTEQRHLLSAYLRTRPRQAIPVPELLDEVRLRELADSLPRYSVLEKQDLLLTYLERQSSSPGRAVLVNPDQDYPLFWMADREEYDYHTQSLIDRELVTGRMEQLTLSYKGWDYLSQMRQSRGTSKQAFVAMWFDESMNDAWDAGFSPAIAEAGFRPRRVDDESHAEQIDHRIFE